MSRSDPGARSVASFDKMGRPTALALGNQQLGFTQGRLETPTYLREGQPAQVTPRPPACGCCIC